MNISIKPLTPELSGDYFDFFENRAFTDNSPYRCYCQMYQMTRAQAKEAFDNADSADIGHISKEIAAQQIARYPAWNTWHLLTELQLGGAMSTIKQTIPLNHVREKVSTRRQKCMKRP